jgi:uncharacterized surface protein with fasciclin (FAS1) repeats
MRYILTLLALVSLSLFVAACGDDDSTENENNTKTETTMTEEKAPEEMPKDIVDTAVAAGDFTTLAAALQAAGLVEALKGEGPFTVFAPTDDAFAALPEGTVEGLLKPEAKEDLTSVLTYHVVPAKALAGDLSDGQKLTTLQGGELTVSIEDDGTVMINDAVVTAADIEASNGVIHVIDSVLLP